ELPREGLFHALFAGVCRGDIIAKRLEVVLDQPAELLVVIYDKNGSSLCLGRIGDHDFILNPVPGALHFLNNREPTLTDPLHGLNQPFTFASSTQVLRKENKIILVLATAVCLTVALAAWSFRGRDVQYRTVP